MLGEGKGLGEGNSMIWVMLNFMKSLYNLILHEFSWPWTLSTWQMKTRCLRQVTQFALGQGWSKDSYLDLLTLSCRCFFFIQQGFQRLCFFDQLLDLESHSFSDDICLGLIRRGRIYRRGENRHTERVMWTQGWSLDWGLVSAGGT